jgi:hypothetical protein
MNLLDKLLAIALAGSILVAGGCLWFADHERQQLVPWQQRAADAAVSASQAAADRDTALQAASDAQAQLRAAQAAFNEAASAALAASAAAASAHAKLLAAASSPDVAKVLTTPVPATVWNAIFDQKGE